MGIDVSPISTFFITPSPFPFFGNGSTFLDGSTAGNATIGNARLPKFSGTSTPSTATIGDGTLSADAGTTSTLSRAISGVGSLTKNCARTLTLSGNNNYSGAMGISAGTFQAGSSKAFSANSAFFLNSLLDLNGNPNTIGSLVGPGTISNEQT
jgi:autotransporter-associated beta strand protein